MLKLDLPIGTEFNVTTEEGTKTFRVVETKEDSSADYCMGCPFEGSELCNRLDDKVVCCDNDRVDGKDVYFVEVRNDARD